MLIVFVFVVCRLLMPFLLFLLLLLVFCLGMQVVLRQVREGTEKSLAECLKTEWRIAQRFMHDARSRTPLPLEQIKDEQVNAFFNPQQGDKELFLHGVDDAKVRLCCFAVLVCCFLM